ncbi:MAG: hypothetical protein ACODAD_12855 [Planctomycetota bacterium]
MERRETRSTAPQHPDPLKIELYNLEQDLCESQDVVADHPDVVARIRKIMQTEHDPSVIFPLGPLDQ